MLSSQYVQTDRLPLAIALVEKAHAAAPDNTRLTATLANLYIRSGKAAEALALVGKDKTAASSIDMLNVQAAAQMALDQKAQALDSYRQIIKLDPSVLAARRAAIALLVQAGNYEDARNLIKDGLVISPRNYQLYYDYVMVDLKAGGIDAALATAKQFRDQDHDFLAARALIGDAYEAANRPADAVVAYQEALAAAPSTSIAGTAGRSIGSHRPE